MIFVTANNHHSVFRPKLLPRIASRQLPAASRPLLLPRTASRQKPEASRFIPKKLLKYLVLCSRNIIFEVHNYFPFKSFVL
jgi:hypothetical protein